MLAIALRFSAGRYHATPWGRHVNEAAVAWPPEPLRLFRALIATWHRKLSPVRFQRERLAALLARLAGAGPPCIRLPEDAIHSHSRHYMPSKGGKTTLVFDAFARIAPDDPIVIAWLDVTLSAEEQDLLDALLESLGYFGRAESWVTAQRLDWEEGFNCLPLFEAESTIDPATGEVLGDIVRVPAPLSPARYDAFRRERLAGDRRPSALLRSLPEDWLDALSVDTADLQAAGWSGPPVAESVAYALPAEALQSVARHVASSRRAFASAKRPTTARFRLYGKPLPRLEHALRVGESMRAAVMSVAAQLLGSERIPTELSGHGLDIESRHTHAFWLPEPDDRGLIQHVLVYASGGFGADALAALTALRQVGHGDGEPLRVMLESAGPREEWCSESALTSEASVWRSLTPWLHPWHLKRRETRSPELLQGALLGQLRREWRHRGNGMPPILTATILEERTVGGRNLRPVHFTRIRRKRGLLQPDTLGRFLEVQFAAPVRGPVALGFGCHFGLGLFSAM